MQVTFGNMSKRQLSSLTIMLVLSILEGILALVGSLMIPSEPGSSVLFGLSAARLAIITIMLLVILLLAVITWASFNQPAWWQRISAIAARVTRSPAGMFTLFCVIFALFLTLLAILLLCVSSAAIELTLLKTIYSRLGLLLGWGVLLLLQLGLLILRDGTTRGQMLRFASTPLRAGLLLALATCIYTVFLKIFLTTTWDLRLRGMESYIFMPALILLAWGMSQHFLGEKRSYALISQIFMFLFIGVTVYTLYWHTAQWCRYEVTRPTAMWHLLAKSFLEGKLYLDNPPTHHDMTFYQGQWYVPSPPLPALMLVPLVALFGLDGINMVQVAILCGAANAVVVYAMLSKASALKMIPTSTAGNLWLTALLAFGTTHWWLSVVGIYWYLSQLLTLLFAGLAVLLALRKSSPWFIGLCLGIALLSRPNVFTLWPLLAGIMLFLAQQAGPIQWKRMAFWAVKTAVPMAACAAGLLFYNFLRFDNFLDFGYVSINSAAFITEAVRTYGMFNIHFLPIDFKMMFLTMPFVGFVDGKFHYSPGFEGTSILAMTPAIIYLFRRFQMNWWTTGAWVSTLLTASLLLLYHNTGSWQLGYRYLMDFILPVLLLMALGVGQRTSRIFIALVLFSVLINAAGIAWWFTHM